MQQAFSAGQAAHVSGVPYRTLDFWARTGFITPSILEAAGAGNARVYSFRDLVALRTAHRLRQSGISLQGLRKVVAYLREIDGLEFPLAQTYLASDGHDVYVRQGDAILSVLHRQGQSAFTWVLDLSAVVEEVQQNLAA